VSVARSLPSIVLVAGLLISCAPKPKTQNGELRIITLTPSSSELVMDLDGTTHLVGVDNYSAKLPPLKDQPTVGDFMSPDFSAIVRLRPTLVVGDAIQAKVGPALEKAGITTLFLPMHSLDDVREGLRTLGKVLKRQSQAREIVAEMEKAIADARARPKTGTPPRVLVVMDREAGGLGGLTAAGPGSYADELLTIVGAENALAGAKAQYPRVGAEQILRANPDVIIEAIHGGGNPDDWNALDTVTAVKRGAIYAADSREYTAPSSNVKAALLWLRDMVYRVPPSP
jgi:iron complex transport system substrate-binding protein